jgi:hypothetical protein
MQVDLDLLENAISDIFNEMRKKGLSSIPLEADFYWNIPSEFKYDPYNEPNQLDIGQLEDDYDTLCQAQNANKLMGYNLKNISAIMRYLSDKYPS